MKAELGCTKGTHEWVIIQDLGDGVVIETQVVGQKGAVCSSCMENWPGGRVNKAVLGLFHQMTAETQTGSPHLN